MEVASFAILARTGSLTKPTRSLCNDLFVQLIQPCPNFIESLRVHVGLLVCLIPRETVAVRPLHIDQTCLTGGLGACGELSTRPPCSCALSRPPRLSTSSQEFEYDRLAEKQEGTRGMKITSAVRLTRTEQEHNQTENSPGKERLKIATINPPFLIETPPAFPLQILRLYTTFINGGPLGWIGNYSIKARLERPRTKTWRRSSNKLW